MCRTGGRKETFQGDRITPKKEEPMKCPALKGMDVIAKSNRLREKRNPSGGRKKKNPARKEESWLFLTQGTKGVFVSQQEGVSSPEALPRKKGGRGKDRREKNTAAGRSKNVSGDPTGRRVQRLFRGIKRKMPLTDEESRGSATRRTCASRKFSEGASKRKKSKKRNLPEKKGEDVSHDSGEDNYGCEKRGGIIPGEGPQDKESPPKTFFKRVRPPKREK